jgi:hypothetical protein
MRHTVLGILVATSSSACTTLGPMPATTGISAIPAARPEVDVQVAAVPVYYVSAGATRDPQGTAAPQVLVVFDPDRILVPGLIVAMRGVDSSGAGGFLEPVLGYRLALSDRFAGALLLYGTHASGSQKGASFSADRIGSELQADLRLTTESPWAELHVSWGIALTGLSGEGHHCVAPDGYGTDCDVSDDTVDVHASGAYVSANAALAVELFRHRESWFHGGRIALSVAGGTMPTYRSGVQTDAVAYGAAGLSMSWAIGTSAPAR